MNIICNLVLKICPVDILIFTFICDVIYWILAMYVDCDLSGSFSC